MDEPKMSKQLIIWNGGSINNVIQHKLMVNTLYLERERERVFILFLAEKHRANEIIIHNVHTTPVGSSWSPWMVNTGKPIL
jgi:hypothetical protein